MTNTDEARYERPVRLAKDIVRQVRAESFTDDERR